MCKLIPLSVGLLFGWAVTAPPMAFAGPPDDPAHLVLQVGPTESVNAVAFSPDGGLIATGSFDGKARVYDARTAALKFATGCDACRGIRALAFSPDGKTLACGGLEMDKTVKVWDPRTGALLRTLAGHDAADPGNLYVEVYALAFSPNGRMLASAGRDKRIVVWDLETGAVRYRLDGAEVGSLAFSPDGAFLAGGADKTVRLWAAFTGAPVHTLRIPAERVNSLAFSPDGKSLVAGGSDWSQFRGRDPSRAPGPVPPGKCDVRAWNVATGEVVWTFIQPGRLSSLAFSPDGARIACGIGDAVRLYDAKTGGADGVAFTHDGEVASVAFSPDGKELVSGSHDRTAAVVPLPGRAARLRLPGSWEQVNAVAISADGSMIASGSGDIRFAEGRRPSGDRALGAGFVRLWEAKTGRMVRVLGSSDQVLSVAFTPDGKAVASGGGCDGAGVVRFFDVPTGQERWKQADHGAAVTAVAVAPDGKSLATAGADGLVRFRDPSTGAVRQTLRGHEGAVTGLAYSADGAILVSGGADQNVRFWDARTGEAGRVLAAGGGKPSRGEGLITSVALSPDGNTVAACCASATPEFGDRVARLWDVRTGRLLHALERDQSRGRIVAFSPDGTTLAASGRGKAIALWDVASGKFVRELQGHPHPAQSVAFSPDGRALVSGGDYQTLMLWDVGGGRLRATLTTFSHGEGKGAADEWAALTPVGFYDGSPGADRLLAWQNGKGPVGRADARRRPDAVQESIRGR